MEVGSKIMYEPGFIIFAFSVRWNSVPPSKITEFDFGFATFELFFPRTWDIYISCISWRLNENWQIPVKVNRAYVIHTLGHTICFKILLIGQRQLREATDQQVGCNEDVLRTHVFCFMYTYDKPIISLVLGTNDCQHYNAYELAYFKDIQ